VNWPLAEGRGIRTVEGTLMNLLYLIALVATVGVLVYLVAVLLFPERFS
jgi:K+-transporting ATPase KdpF subunit